MGTGGLFRRRRVGFEQRLRDRRRPRIWPTRAIQLQQLHQGERGNQLHAADVYTQLALVLFFKSPQQYTTTVGYLVQLIGENTLYSSFV